VGQPIEGVLRIEGILLQHPGAWAERGSGEGAVRSNIKFAVSRHDRDTGQIRYDCARKRTRQFFRELLQVLHFEGLPEARPHPSPIVIVPSFLPRT
jgi:hypothetical protein